MEIIFYLATASLILFMILATYDGFYLHIFKYGLFNHEESFFEHKTHTIRAILFPFIIWSLFINESNFNLFLFGITLVVLDMIVLGIDAYSEKESRNFMGGLPKWEYIIHLFSNAFHFSAIVLVLALKIKVTGRSLIFVDEFATSSAQGSFAFVSINVIPGAIILALLHLILLLETPRAKWNNFRAKIMCC
ncbi:MAG: hypothetical protein WBM98_05705 [Maribacter sp.]|uniref:hypothetical protein n=1 Tax=Maribacter sp. TaxID=1897614 RepID=UPI003C796DA2